MTDRDGTHRQAVDSPGTGPKQQAPIRSHPPAGECTCRTPVGQWTDLPKGTRPGGLRVTLTPGHLQTHYPWGVRPESVEPLDDSGSDDCVIWSTYPLRHLLRRCHLPLHGEEQDRGNAPDTGHDVSDPSRNPTPPGGSIQNERRLAGRESKPPAHSSGERFEPLASASRGGPAVCQSGARR